MSENARPTEYVEQIRELLTHDEALTPDESARLRDLVERLDNWMGGGGPLPQQWMILR